MDVEPLDHSDSKPTLQMCDTPSFTAFFNHEFSDQESQRDAHWRIGVPMIHSLRDQRWSTRGLKNEVDFGPLKPQVPF